jgi:hypothetical protein
MKNFVVSVATNSPTRIKSFIDSINKTIDKEELFLVITDTSLVGLHQELLETIEVDYHYTHYLQTDVIPYAEIMRLKLENTKSFCDDNTLYCNVDDDYVFNPYWYQVAKTIFNGHSEISYLSLLKVSRTQEESLQARSGFNLIRAYSCMGGAFCTRYKDFYPVITVYFEEFGTNNMFDQGYWVFLGKLLGRQDNIFILQDFSLIQQCNLISTYLNQKGSKKEHQYGIDFEPVGNPFVIVT